VLEALNSKGRRVPNLITVYGSAWESNGANLSVQNERCGNLSSIRLRYCR